MDFHKVEERMLKANIKWHTADSEDDDSLSETTFLLLIYMGGIGTALYLLLSGTLTQRWGAATGWIVGSAAIFYIAYSVMTRTRRLRQALISIGLDISKSWLATAMTLSLITGAICGHFVLEPIGWMKKYYGTVPTIVVAVLIIMPLFWFGIQYLVRKFIKVESVSTLY